MILDILYYIEILKRNILFLDILIRHEFLLIALN